MGGALGVAASPLLVPGLAFAAVVGGAGGYHWAKYWGSQELQHETGHGEGDMATCPSMRRLKFMVKWSQWQLRAFEGASVEARMAVLDEVTRAFSPWVQRLYLLRTQPPGSAEMEIAEVQEHLAPLFFLLHRRVAVETIEAAALALAADFDQSNVDVAGADRAKVVFPIMLETISTLDRLSPAAHTQLLKVTQASAKLQATFNDQRAQRRRRLQLIVTAICQVIERDDVKRYLADPHFLAHLQLRPPPVLPDGNHSDTETVSSRASSPSIHHATARRMAPLELPPRGAEEDEDDAFFSFSEGSDDGAKGRAKSRARLGCKGRTERCPKGHLPHSWNLGDCSNWRLRSETYFRDRRKLPCCATMLELLHCDWLAVGDEGPVPRVSEHPDFFPAVARKTGDERFLLVVNFVLGDFQVVVTMALNPQAAWLADETSPQSRVWRNFLQGDDDSRMERFKLILAVEEGPWLVKKAFIKKPMLICKLLGCRFHQSSRHLEVAFQKATGATVGVVLKSMKRAVLSCALLLEAKEPEELPEHLLATAVANYVDPSKFCCPLKKSAAA
ncbi:unnamed protein product [Effrenium voratum]|nr:unnamed protein product [Effrenium voratum]